MQVILLQEFEEILQLVEPYDIDIVILSKRVEAPTAFKRAYLENVENPPKKSK